MTTKVSILTFGASAQQFPAASGNGLVRRIYAQPLRSNTHICYVGDSTVTNDASGTGVIQELATPGAATQILDSFTYQDDTGSNRLDPTGFWAHGFSGEKLKVSYVTQ